MLPSRHHADPLLYEINTRCWLHEWGVRAGHAVTLAQVPESEFQRWRQLGFTHIWLMGAWKTGPAARRLARRDDRILDFHARHFPNLTPEETIGGSPYAIADYHVPAAMGGMNGLAKFRSRLHAHGLKLILDFVPNHTALDHPWTHTHPDLFVTKTKSAPEFFPVDSTASGKKLWLAHGRDPHFPAWHDTAQLDYRQSSTHEAMTQELLRISDHCDGVRCDMAMLLLPDVFTKTWQHAPAQGSEPMPDFWTSAIPRVKERHPDFLMMAEVYWELESRLQQMGFDYTYDKAFYDFILRYDLENLNRRLRERSPTQIKADVHFLENHDEIRIAETLPRNQHQAAATLLLTLPGMRMVHEGQLQGAHTQVPVQMNRRPAESLAPQIAAFYSGLLETLSLLEIPTSDREFLNVHTIGSPPDEPDHSLMGFVWKAGSSLIYLVCVNFSNDRKEGRFSWPAEWSTPSSPHPPRQLWGTTDQASLAFADKHAALVWTAQPWEAGLFQMDGNGGK